MIDGLHTTYSAIVAQEKKAGAAVQNIAHAGDAGYTRKRVVVESREQGGVSAITEEIQAPGQSSAPIDGVARSEMSQVDLGEEIVELTVAQRALEANAVSLKTHDETLGTLLDIMA